MAQLRLWIAVAALITLLFLLIPFNALLMPAITASLQGSASQARDMIFVDHDGDQSLILIDTQSHATVADIPVPVSSYSVNGSGLISNPSGTRLYISEIDGVGVINTINNSMITHVPFAAPVDG